MAGPECLLFRGSTVYSEYATEPLNKGHILRPASKELVLHRSAFIDRVFLGPQISS